MALVTFSPFVAAYCDEPWVRKIIYFGSNDWATGEPLRPWWNAYRDAYSRIDERGGDIFVISEELGGRISDRAVVIPNGVDPADWQPRHPAPPRIQQLPRPRAIYAGTIGDRLDTDLVERTAAAVASFVVIGHYEDPSVTNWLRSLDNVYTFDHVGRRELAATVQACDVGVIPHRDEAVYRVMSPLKLYEYVAAGLPVVAVDFPPIHGVDDERVFICSPDEWTEGLSRACALGPANEARRLEFIESVSWESRMRPVVDAAVG